MTDIRDKYRIISTGAGWIDRSRLARMRVEGRDAAAFLHALVSNDVAALTAGRGVYATWLTPQGRMIADLSIYHRGDHLLVVVPPGLATALVTRLDQLIFAEDVRVSDVTDAIAQIAVIGTRAAATAATACALDASRVEVLVPLEQTGTDDTFIARSDDALLTGFDIFAPTERRAALVSALEGGGAIPIEDDLYESLRIEAARPRFGVDMTTDTIPLEAGLLERGISTTKGCYVGQEVIVRVLHRGGGRVAKRLMTLAFDRGLEALPAPGTPLHVDGREVGRVTSAAWSPHEPRAIALGYVHRDHAEVGRRVTAQIAGMDTFAEITGFAG
jgi:folate-binding protein YgfZ